MEMYTKKNALRCINNRFRIESLTSESESNQIHVISRHTQIANVVVI